MELREIINNSTLTDQIKSLYDYKDFNTDLFDDIFEKIYNDLKSIFTNIEKTDTYIRIIPTDGYSIKNKNIITDAVKHHIKDNLTDNNMPYEFIYKIYSIDNYIDISKNY